MYRSSFCIFLLFCLLRKEDKRMCFIKKEPKTEGYRLFIVLLIEELVVFCFSNDSFESFWVVHCEVSKNFAVHSDTSFVQCAHKL